MNNIYIKEATKKRFDEQSKSQLQIFQMYLHCLSVRLKLFGFAKCVCWSYNRALSASDGKNYLVQNYKKIIKIEFMSILNLIMETAVVLKSDEILL